MNNFFFTNLSKNYFLFLLIFSSYTLPAFSEPGISVFMYHRFGENKYPSTNVSEEQFFSHIDYIHNNEIKIKSKIGYLPESNPLYEDMYVRESIGFIAQMHKVNDWKTAAENVIKKNIKKINIIDLKRLIFLLLLKNFSKK